MKTYPALTFRFVDPEILAAAVDDYSPTAIEPLEPKGPSTRVALAVAAIAGLLLAIMGAVLLELMNRRVRSIDDLSMATHLPILASLPAHNGPASLARLAHAPARPALAYRGSLA